jgi:hypothetical protein
MRAGDPVMVVMGMACQLPAAQAASSAWLNPPRCWSCTARWRSCWGWALMTSSQLCTPGSRATSPRIRRWRGRPARGRGQRRRVLARSPAEFVCVVGLVVDSEQTVGDLSGDGRSFGAERGDQHGELERARRGVVGGVQHPHGPVVPLHRFTAQRHPEGAHVAREVRPGGRLRAEGPCAIEPGAERDRDPAWRQRRQHRRPGGIDHRMAQRGDEYAGAESDPAGLLRGQGEHGPDIRALRRGVEQPCPLVAQSFRVRDVLGRAQRCGELAGNIHRAPSTIRYLCRVAVGRTLVARRSCGVRYV